VRAGPAVGNPLAGRAGLRLVSHLRALRQREPRARRTAAPAGRPPGPAADTCVWRAGIPASSACAEGGPEDKLYEKGCCPRCSLRRRAQQLQAGVPETTRPPASPSLASP